MKSIQKRLYTAVQPRVRSNSVSSSSSPNRNLYTSSSTSPPLAFFDSPTGPPPPPTSRLNASPARLPVKGEGAGEGQQHSNASHQPPFSLALTSAPAGPNSPPHAPHSSPYASGSSSSFFPYPGRRHALCGAQVPERKERRRRGPRYQLDVGAYGIAKKRPGQGGKRPEPGSESHTEDLGLSVQVGEDAYFVRDNAMGVADGVGGWAKRACLFDFPVPLSLHLQCRLDAHVQHLILIVQMDLARKTPPIRPVRSLRGVS